MKIFSDRSSGEYHVRNSNDELHLTVNTAILPQRDLLDENESTGIRKKSRLATSNSKSLYILLIIVALLIIITVGTMLWIVYRAKRNVSQYDEQLTTTQSLPIETSSSKALLWHI